MTAVVRETLQLPGGAPADGALVTVELRTTEEPRPSVAYAADWSVAWSASTTTDDTGRWTMSLDATDDLQLGPAADGETLYRVTVERGQRDIVPPRWFQVPPGPGPWGIEDLEVDVPIGLPRYGTVDAGHVGDDVEMIGDGGDPDTSDWEHLVDGGGP